MTWVAAWGVGAFVTANLIMSTADEGPHPRPRFYRWLDAAAIVLWPLFWLLMLVVFLWEALR